MMSQRQPNTAGSHASRQRRRMLAAVHIKAKQLGLSEDERRDIQLAAGGSRSCKDMTMRQLGLVLDALGGKRMAIVASRRDASAPRMLAKIEAQCRALGVGTHYAEGIARRMWMRTLAECNPTQLRAVIAALTYRADRTD